MYNRKEREYYNEQRDRACKRLGITKNQYNWLRRKGEELNKIYTANCNGDYEKLAQGGKVDAETMYNMDCTTKEGLIGMKVKELGLKVFFQTDPRGATIYLDTKEIPSNNYTQAVCIY